MVKNRVKERRSELGMTQEELSEKSGVSRTIISKIESNQKIDVKLSTLVALANALKQSVESIFLL